MTTRLVLDLIAYAIVVVAALSLLCGLFSRYLAGPLSRFLLKRGKVKWAMKVRDCC